MSLLPNGRAAPAARRTLSRTCGTLAQCVAAASAGAPLPLLREARRHRRPIARARQTACYLAHVACGGDFTSIGGAFRRDRTTVRYACGRIEDLRDDPRIDLALQHLEAGMRLWLAGVLEPAT